MQNRITKDKCAAIRFNSRFKNVTNRTHIPVGADKHAYYQQI